MANSKARLIQRNQKNEQVQNLDLFLDIDLATQKITSIQFVGTQSETYFEELQVLKNLVLGKTIEEALSLKRNELNPNNDFISLRGQWLLHKAIDQYLGREKVAKESSERLCLCYGVGISDIKKELLKNSDFSLKDLIGQTFATSACGSCLSLIKKTMDELRLDLGILENTISSDQAMDQNGQWIKIKGMYPGALIVWIDQFKKDWMLREGIVSDYSIEFTQIKGLHLFLKILGLKGPLTSEKKEKIAQALEEFLKSTTGIRFFIHGI